jgi:hypothetical protein
MNLRVESDLRKDPRITEGPIKLTFQNGLEIYRAGQAIVETQQQ